MARYQPFNDLPAKQFQALKDDIEARGIVNPILVDEDDKTIDGHQRRRAAAELGIDCPRITLDGLSEDDKVSLAIALNTFRRHLNGDERASALQKMASLGMSVRRIADATGVPKSTVQRDLTAAGVPLGTPARPEGVNEDGEIDESVYERQVEEFIENGPSPVPTRLGKDNRVHPATKPKADKPEPSEADQALAALAEEINASDTGYRATVSRCISNTRSGLLTLDAVRVAEVCTQDDRAAWLAFANDVSAWAMDVSRAMKKSGLKAVK